MSNYYKKNAKSADEKAMEKGWTCAKNIRIQVNQYTSRDMGDGYIDNHGNMYVYNKNSKRFRKIKKDYKTIICTVSIFFDKYLY